MYSHMTGPTFCIQSCNDVVCVVGEEPPVVEHRGEHLGHGHDTEGGQHNGGGINVCVCVCVRACMRVHTVGCQ